MKSKMKCLCLNHRGGFLKKLYIGLYAKIIKTLFMEMSMFLIIKITLYLKNSHLRIAHWPHTSVYILYILQLNLPFFFICS